MSQTVTCYCGAVMRLRDGRWGKWYSCPRWPECDGAVGCHKGTDKPLGAPADGDTRKARIRAHDAFDALWKPLGRKYRSVAYAWLADELGMDADDAHMAEMDAATCARVVEVCEAAGPEDVVGFAEADQ